MSEHGRILVVDDLRTNRLKLALGLKQQGHTVAEAERRWSGLGRPGYSTENNEEATSFTQTSDFLDFMTSNVLHAD